MKLNEASSHSLTHSLTHSQTHSQTHSLTLAVSSMTDFPDPQLAQAAASALVDLLPQCPTRRTFATCSPVNRLVGYEPVTSWTVKPKSPEVKASSSAVVLLSIQIDEDNVEKFEGERDEKVEDQVDFEADLDQYTVPCCCPEAEKDVRESKVVDVGQEVESALTLDRRESYARRKSVVSWVAIEPPGGRHGTVVEEETGVRFTISLSLSLSESVRSENLTDFWYTRELGVIIEQERDWVERSKPMWSGRESSGSGGIRFSALREGFFLDCFCFLLPMLNI